MPFSFQITAPTSIHSLKQQLLILGCLPPTTLIKLISKGKTYSDDDNIQGQQITSTHHSNPNKFFNISTLKFLPDEPTAKLILKQLANDHGVLHCLKLHNWLTRSPKRVY